MAAYRRIYDSRHLRADCMPRTGISSGTLRSVIEYGLPLPFYRVTESIQGHTFGKKSISQAWCCKRVVFLDGPSLVDAAAPSNSTLLLLRRAWQLCGVTVCMREGQTFGEKRPVFGLGAATAGSRQDADLAVGIN